MAACEKLTDLVLGELRLLSSANKSYVVCSTKHFRNSDSGIEILRLFIVSLGSDGRVESSVR